MLTLLGVGFVAGLVTAISPCILPVLPVIFAGASTGGRRRSVAIVFGLVMSFSLATLFGLAVLKALHLPDDLLNWLGIAMLLVLAISLIFDPIGELLERPFAKLAVQPRVGAGTSSGIVLGLGLGLVFVPCSGLILGAIGAVDARNRVGVTAVALMAAYALGVAIPLLLFALLSQRLANTWGALRTHARAVRRVAGVLIGAMAIVIVTNAAAPLQDNVPGYASSFESTVPPAVETQLNHLTGEHTNVFQKKQDADPAASLPDEGTAPPFTDITAWLNTPGDRPLTLQQLRGKVVLVDFWTYSCINCRRSLPHVEAWYRAYARYGLVVVGVHTPEFAFEHVVSNVASALPGLGVKYPVAIDDDYGTWYAYNNMDWPAEYLIDQNGQVRHISIGEGDYGTMEKDIRLLLEAGGATNLPPPTEVANRTPTEETTPESYLGYDRLDNDAGNNVIQDVMTTYQLASPLPDNALSFGGRWAIHAEDATSGANATLALQFTARDVYLVLGGAGTVSVTYDNGTATTFEVRGFPDLYTLFSSTTSHSGVLRLTVSPGVRAYDLTFG